LGRPRFGVEPEAQIEGENAGDALEGASAPVMQTRRWPLEQAFSVEQQRGHWTIGYHADPL
jgi:hypothetical protein